VKPVVALEPKAPESPGLPRVDGNPDGVGVVEKPKPPELESFPNVDPVLGWSDIVLLVLPKPPDTVDVLNGESVAGFPKAGEVVVFPNVGVKVEAVGSNEKPDLDEFAGEGAGWSSATNMLSASSSASYSGRPCSPSSASVEPDRIASATVTPLTTAVNVRRYLFFSTYLWEKTCCAGVEDSTQISELVLEKWRGHGYTHCPKT
jgi:hypothetical protein